MAYAVQFGFCVPVFANPGPSLFRTPNLEQLDPDQSVALALQAETWGFDSLWVADHVMLGHQHAILEGWTTLALLAGRTHRVRLGLIHQAHPLRHPVMAAKMAATLDVLSHGRFVYFVDWGRRADEFERYGLIAGESKAERIAQMVEGLELTLALWTRDEPLTVHGAYYRVDQAVVRPKPLQTPHPPIWIGETDPELLRLAARVAEGWNLVFAGEELLRQGLTQLEMACRDVGRDIETVERSVELQVLVATTRKEALDRLRAILDQTARWGRLDPQWEAVRRAETSELPKSARESWLFGSPDDVRERLRRLIGLGVTHFLLWFLDVPETDGMQTFRRTILAENHAW